MTRIGLIRHGCTDWNKQGRAQGHSDIPLCEEGYGQAEKLALRLADEEWNVIYSSDLKRAKQTAETIAEKKNIEVNLDTRLRERYGGQIEGTTLKDRIEKWGEGWRNLDLGMEIGEKISERGMACLKDIMADHPDDNVLIVSHGAFIKQILRTLFPDVDVESSLDNCSITVLEAKEGIWDLTLHNCVKHI